MIDRFTKAVLTVIAIALMVLVVQNAISVSRAKEGDLQKIHYCDSLSCAAVRSHKIQKHGPWRLLVIDAVQIPVARMSRVI
jgi:hypothetical protein